MVMGLEEYRDKRDFQRTPEPPPELTANQGPLTFVVQKHHARQLHYDFRLELDGVLKSWSVPKGPSLDPQEKRLAVMVEGHPLGYAAFEGVIPKGAYGAGEVIVWDNGAYFPENEGRSFFTDRAAAEEAMRQGLEKGKLSFTLRGHKLKGSWTLVKMHNREKEWLLMKHQDEYASPGSDVLKEERSVLSNRTIEDVKLNRPAAPAAALLNPKDLPGAILSPFPSVVAPMLASLVEGTFSHPDWIFEPKLDGYRVIACRRAGEVSLFSRQGNNVTRQYATLVPDLSRQPASEIILDGEIIAMDEKGRQCFQCLQEYLKSVDRTGMGQPGQYPLIYYVFDILYLDGYDLRSMPLRLRKALLHGILRPSDQVRLVDYFEKEGETIYRAAVKNGLEGVIAKRTDSKYESGKRSRNWLKVKAMLSDDFVIGGYSVAKGGREQTFSSLLLGRFDDRGKLIFAGHVGSGFDEEILSDLRSRLDSLRVDRCPFSEEPPLNAPTTWVQPELVAEVKFSGWTQEGRLRIPVFVRLREDKASGEIRVEEAVAAPKPPPETRKDETTAILQQVQNPKDTFTVDAEGSKIRLNNMDKILWPATDDHPDLTKRDLLSYLVKVSSYMLPHLQDRPLTLTRYPDGIYGKHFYQKHWSNPIPDYVRRVNIRDDSSTSEYLICDNLSTLLWLGQVANLEFHTWFSRTSAGAEFGNNKEDTLEYPDFIILDLDPYIYSGEEPLNAEPELNREGFSRACEVAIWLKDVLDELSLKAFVKTSGKTGLHIYVPIVRNLSYKSARTAAELIGRFLVQRHPAQVTVEWAQEKRRGKVFIDYGQNVRGKTLASIYSPRPVTQALVSTPLRWEELGKVYAADFTISSVPDRLRETGDLWADILLAKRDVSELLRAK